MLFFLTYTGISLVSSPEDDIFIQQSAFLKSFFSWTSAQSNFFLAAVNLQKYACFPYLSLVYLPYLEFWIQWSCDCFRLSKIATGLKIRHCSPDKKKKKQEKVHLSSLFWLASVLGMPQGNALGKEQHKNACRDTACLTIYRLTCCSLSASWVSSPLTILRVRPHQTNDSFIQMSICLDKTDLFILSSW